MPYKSDAIRRAVWFHRCQRSKTIPYQSKAQERLFFAKEERGELPKGTAERWAHHTKNIKALPEHKRKKKAAQMNYSPSLIAFGAMLHKYAKGESAPAQPVIPHTSPAATPLAVPTNTTPSLIPPAPPNPPPMRTSPIPQLNQMPMLNPATPHLNENPMLNPPTAHLHETPMLNPPAPHLHEQPQLVPTPPPLATQMQFTPKAARYYQSPTVIAFGEMLNKYAHSAGGFVKMLGKLAADAMPPIGAGLPPGMAAAALNNTANNNQVDNAMMPASIRYGAQTSPAVAQDKLQQQALQMQRPDVPIPPQQNVAKFGCSTTTPMRPRKKPQLARKQ